VILLVSAVLVLPGSAFAQSQEQTGQEQPKKKPRRVWTNDDFASGSRPAEERKEAAGAGEPQRTAEELFAELDQARTELAVQENELRLARIQYDAQLERLRNADNDYDRNAYRTSMDVADRRLNELEETVEGLKTRIAELEQLTAGMKRPAGKPKPVQKEAVPVQTPDTVLPAGGPIPKKEPPPEP
jgi:chromosome segregation ATPase